MENNEEVEYFKVDVDMAPFVSDEAKELRKKITACQRQMDYLVFKYNLFVKQQNDFKKQYNKVLGVDDNGEPVQQK